MANIIFIEDLNDQHPMSDKNDTIIALTPYVMYQLDKRKIKYKIPEDYYIYQEDENYQEWFYRLMGFFRRNYIDYYFANDITKKMYPYFMYHFLTMFRNVIDSLVRATLQYKQILKQEQPKRIWYFVNKKLMVDVIDDELYFKTRSIYQIITEYICWVNNLSLHFVPVSNEVKNTRSKIRDNKILRFVYNYFRSYMFVPRIKNNDPILFADFIPDRIKDCKLSGYKIKVLKESKINFSEKKNNFDFDGIFDLFEGIGIESKLAHELLNIRFTYFMNKIIPEVLAYIKYFIDYFQRNKFSCIVFNRRNKLYHYGALIAAKHVGLKTVYCRHGWDLYDNWIRKYNHFGLYDYHVCYDMSDVEFFRNKVNEWKVNTEVL